MGHRAGVTPLGSIFAAESYAAEVRPSYRSSLIVSWLGVAAVRRRVAPLTFTRIALSSSGDQNN